MKNQKGITLIALIITIIVMLILVAVTINVALNGGLFNNATDAKTKTQREADREQLISAVIATLDREGKVVFTGENGLDANLPDGFKVVSTGIYENEKTGKQYKVDALTGNVEEYAGVNPGGGEGGQVTYLNYDADPLPKFTFNPDPSELLQNTEVLEVIVKDAYEHGEYWGTVCDAPFIMLNEEVTSGVSCEFRRTARRYLLYIM